MNSSSIEILILIIFLNFRDPGRAPMLYPDSGISMDEEIVLGDLIWSYFKAEL